MYKLNAVKCAKLKVMCFETRTMLKFEPLNVFVINLSARFFIVKG
jgi:hypothetical protein